MKDQIILKQQQEKVKKKRDLLNIVLFLNIIRTINHLSKTTS